jgi:hypothetical protein
MSWRSPKTKNGRRCPTPTAVSHPEAGGRTVNATKLAILITFLSILVKGKIHYCEPHPDTTIGLLLKFHGIEIGRRWFFQCMLDLETAGYMRRQRRWLKLPGPEIRSNSSLWVFTIRGIKFLVSKSIRGAQELLKSMLSWMHRGDNRRPTEKDLAGTGEAIDREEAIIRIKTLIRDIG